MIQSNMFLCINMIYVIFFSSVIKTQAVSLISVLELMKLIDAFVIMQSDLW